jgi:hypothetical protein
MYALPFALPVTDDYRYDSDVARIKLATERPDMVWLDCDCTIEDWWVPPDDDKPYFYNALGNPDPCIFFVNGNTGFFKDLIKKHDKDPRMHVVGWVQMLLGMSVCGLIPNGKFSHKKFKDKI